MGKFRFPKERPEITQKLEEAKKLIAQSPDDIQTVLQVYNMISECAEAGSPRGCFLKACFLYADEAQSGDHKDEILPLLDAAIKEKYPLAYGMKVDYLLAFEDSDLLYNAIRKCKIETPQALYYEGGFWARLCDPPKGLKKNLSKAIACFERSAQLYLEYDRAYRAGCTELSDIIVCFRNPDFFTSQAAYAYQMLMYVYADMDAKENVPRYIAAYDNAQRYGNLIVQYKTASTRATDCMNNVLGMHSLKTVNAVLKTAKAAYAQLDEAQQERLQENYDELWALYDEFYDYEMQRLEEIGNMEVYTSPDYARQDSLLSDFANAVQQWSETRQAATEYTVKVGNKTYRLNEHGEMVDEYGQGNGLHVDTTSRKVYDSKNDAVGFFDSFGEFHKY
ncbi:MAG: hypothetical protein K2L87_03830 [Clostridiales bacterium]|nr:hypothetical protein [Clostridiales bacterium]